MFDKEKFSTILKEINNTYDNQTQFGDCAHVNRAYLSQYMNMKLDNPPSPKILKNIANASKDLTTYEYLMKICGYFEKLSGERLKTSRLNKNMSLDYVSVITKIPVDTLNNWENGNNYNADFESYKSLSILYCVDLDWLIGGNSDNYTELYYPKDTSMSPLLDIGDTAYILKKETFTSGETILFELNGEEFIRKVITIGDSLEFFAMNPNYPTLRKTKEDLEKENFKVIGKVLKAL